ncbi:hypothetical protein DPSP01_011087 [Paraphaeosphaeria sporulosa]
MRRRGGIGRLISRKRKQSVSLLREEVGRRPGRVSIRKEAENSEFAEDVENERAAFWLGHLRDVYQTRGQDMRPREGDAADMRAGDDKQRLKRAKKRRRAP